MNCHLYSQTSRKLAQVATCFAESRLKGRRHRNASQIIHRVFPGPVRADLEDALAGVADELGGKVPDPVAERVQVGVPQVFAVVEAEEAGPGGQAGGDAGGEDPAGLTCGYRSAVDGSAGSACYGSGFNHAHWCGALGCPGLVPDLGHDLTLIPWTGC